MRAENVVTTMDPSKGIRSNSQYGGQSAALCFMDLIGSMMQPGAGVVQDAGGLAQGQGVDDRNGAEGQSCGAISMEACLMAMLVPQPDNSTALPGCGPGQGREVVQGDVMKAGMGREVVQGDVMKAGQGREVVQGDVIKAGMGQSEVINPDVAVMDVLNSGKRATDVMNLTAGGSDNTEVPGGTQVDVVVDGKANAVIQTPLGKLNGENQEFPVPGDLVAVKAVKDEGSGSAKALLSANKVPGDMKSGQGQGLQVQAGISQTQEAADEVKVIMQNIKSGEHIIVSEEKPVQTAALETMAIETAGKEATDRTVARAQDKEQPVNSDTLKNTDSGVGGQARVYTGKDHHSMTGNGEKRHFEAAVGKTPEQVKDAGACLDNLDGGKTETRVADGGLSSDLPAAGRQEVHINGGTINLSNITPRKFPAEMMPHLSGALKSMSGENNKVTVIRLKLVPENLGEINVKLSYSKEGLTAHFFTSSGVVRDAVESSLPQLKESLSQYNIDLREAAAFAGQNNKSSGGNRFNGQWKNGYQSGMAGVMPLSGSAEVNEMSGYASGAGVVDMLV